MLFLTAGRWSLTLHFHEGRNPTVHVGDALHRVVKGTILLYDRHSRRCKDQPLNLGDHNLGPDLYRNQRHIMGVDFNSRRLRIWYQLEEDINFVNHRGVLQVELYFPTAQPVDCSTELETVRLSSSPLINSSTDLYRVRKSASRRAV